MNIHIIDIHYLVNENEVAKVRPSHRKFLDIGYGKGIFLASGPKECGAGGVILAKGNIKEIKEFIKDDPFYVNNTAEYSFNTFNAVKHIPELS